MMKPRKAYVLYLNNVCLSAKHKLRCLYIYIYIYISNMDACVDQIVNCGVKI